ncbi:ABC transporter substrate-binding protein [Natrarchaeobius oligotrophus]|nr:PhnD/SsuA/transferrin family substrate-binding protein [Natrarchaeobius chitinivorans]
MDRIIHVGMLNSNTQGRRRFLKAAGVGTVVGLAGCTGTNGDDDTADDDDGNGTADGSTDDSDAELPDTIGIGTPSPVQPLYYFSVFPEFQELMEDRHGVTVELTNYGGYASMIAGLFQEEVHIAPQAPLSVINSLNEGMDLVSPLSFVQGYPQPLMATPEIESWEDLEGETIALHDPQAGTTFSVKLMVRENLGSMDAVDYDYIFGSDSRYAAIEAGEVVAATVSATLGARAERDGFTILEEGLERDEPFQLWTMMRQNWEQNPELYDVIVNTLHEAQTNMYEVDEDDIVDRALDIPVDRPESYGDLDREIAIDVFERMRNLNTWPEEGGLSNAAIEQVQDTIVDVEEMDEEDRVNRDDFVIIDEFDLE